MIFMSPQSGVESTLQRGTILGTNSTILRINLLKRVFFDKNENITILKRVFVQEIKKITLLKRVVV